MNGAARVRDAIERRSRAGEAAICAYLTAGYPDMESFAQLADSAAAQADLLEIGLPFTDPMADGRTVQQASHAALRAGFRIERMFRTLAERPPQAPLLVMSYLNPLLAFGFEGFCERCGESGVDGLVIPDLPLEEAVPYREVLERHGMAHVPLTTPSTPPERLERLCAGASGFVYAVNVNGVTGGELEFEAGNSGYLGRVAAAAPLPVLAGFGVRRADQVRRLARVVDGVVIGSALVEAVDRGQDPGVWLAELREALEGEAS